MPIPLRILLITVSVLSLLGIVRRIRTAKAQIEYAIFWILFSVLLILMALLPECMIWLSDLLGIQSPVNMIYLMVIFILMLELFHISLQLSAQEYRLRELIQKIALLEMEQKKKGKEDTHEGNTGNGSEIS